MGACLLEECLHGGRVVGGGEAVVSSLVRVRDGCGEASGIGFVLLVGVGIVGVGASALEGDGGNSVVLVSDSGVVGGRGGGAADGDVAVDEVVVRGLKEGCGLLIDATGKFGSNLFPVGEDVVEASTSGAGMTVPCVVWAVGMDRGDDEVEVMRGVKKKVEDILRWGWLWWADAVGGGIVDGVLEVAKDDGGDVGEFVMEVTEDRVGGVP